MASFSLVAALFFIAMSCFLSFRRRRSLPPGPFPLPIIGNMLQIGNNPHETFAKLSKKYGPLMSIRIGSRCSVIASSPEMAKEIMLKYGQVFSGRMEAQAVEACGHDKLSMGFLPAGAEWRALRKLCQEKIFSHQSMEASQGLRQQKLQQLLDHARKCSDEGRAIDIREAAFITTLNLMSATLFSLQATEFDSKVTMEFKEIIEGVASISVVPNLADFFPILRPFDPQGVKRRAHVYFARLLGLIEGYLNERIQSRKTNPKKDDFLETIVDILETNDYNNLNTHHYSHLMMDLFVGATETSMTSIEWIMSELVMNPDKMEKLKAELKSVAGEKQILEESEMGKLTYLNAVIKEVLRIHPPGPLLLPRKAESDQVVKGYMIPKGTQIVINAWAIGRDPTIWEDPDSFKPERFLDQKIDYKGQDYELLPFGSGRRVCPGIPLANRILHMTVATLVHNFDWKLEDESTVEADHAGKLNGAVVRRAVPLTVIPILNS